MGQVLNYTSKGLRVEAYGGGFIIADHHPQHGGSSRFGETYRGISSSARSQPIVDDPFPTKEAAEAEAQRLADTYPEYR